MGYVPVRKGDLNQEVYRILALNRGIRTRCSPRAKTGFTSAEAPEHRVDGGVFHRRGQAVHRDGLLQRRGPAPVRGTPKGQAHIGRPYP